MKTINKVGIIGAGTMGAALAQKFAQNSFQVTLADKNQENLKKGITGICRSLEEGVSKKIFSPETTGATLSRIKDTTDLREMAGCDLIIEAIFENFDAKVKLFEELGRLLPADAIVATNTSSFSVDRLAACISHPERFIGLHYFFHAAKNRLVEIIPGAETSADTFRAMQVFSVLSGKDAITCKDRNGFVVNRFFVPWLNEAVRLLEEGAGTTGEIDAVCCQAFGIGMGPFALMNATGVPVAFHSQKTLEMFGPFYKVCETLKRQAEAGSDWEITWPQTTGEKDSVSQDTFRRIADRMQGAVFMACGQLLDEDVCSAVDINRGARIGLAWQKGPVDIMKKMGEEEVKRMIQTVLEKHPDKMPDSIGEKYWRMDYVRLEKNGPAALITMDSPEDMNALNETVLRQLGEKFAMAEEDQEVRTIFLTGSGKAFVAGADIRFFVNKIKNNRIGDILAFTEFGQGIFDRIDRSSKKVVAVLNGLTLGGGLELALCADVILAFPGASVAFPETGIGIYPGLGGTQRTQKRIGKALTKYLVLSGDMLTAEDARLIGLVDALIQPAEFFGLIRGNGQLPEYLANKRTVEGKYAKIGMFFEENSLDNILGRETWEAEEADKLAKKIRRKAPIALRIAEKLIEEEKGCKAELEEIPRIFATSDALLGLSSIGQRVEFKGE